MVVVVLFMSFLSLLTWFTWCSLEAMMPHSHGGPPLFPNLASLFFSATWSGMVFGVRHLAVQPGTGGSSGIVHRNLSKPDLNFSTGQPVMVLSSFGRTLKILGLS